jgi:hypothetical protein
VCTRDTSIKVSITAATHITDMKTPYGAGLVFACLPLRTRETSEAGGNTNLWHGGRPEYAHRLGYVWELVIACRNF